MNSFFAGVRMTTKKKKYKCCICGKVTQGRKPNTLKLRSSGIMWAGMHKNNGKVCDGTWMEAEVVKCEVKSKTEDRLTADDVKEWT